MTSLTFLAVALLAARPGQVDLDRRGREAFQAGDYAAAAEAFGALLERLPVKDPLRLQTQYNHARALQEAGAPCEAMRAFEAYLGDPRAAQRKEAKRRPKAQAGHEKAQADCRAREAAERTVAPPVERPVEPVVVEAPVVVAPPPTRGDFLLLAGLVSGAVFGEEAARARTTLAIGGGYGTGRWIGDLEARLSVENPDADADSALMLRPGLRWKWREFAYLRAAVPLLLSPVMALGAHGGAGLRYPPTGTFGATGEAGVTLWAADPALGALEARLGMEAAF